MQKLGISIEGVLRYRTQDEQAILNANITYEEFQEIDDALNTLMQTDFPNDHLPKRI